MASIKLTGNAGNHAAFIKGGHTTNGDTILTFHTDAHDSGINPEERVRINSSGKVIVGNNGTTFGNAAVQAFIQHGNTAGESGFSSVDTTSVAAGVGGEIAFHGKYNTGAQDYAYYGHIRGIKENATNGNTACALTFHTRPNATAPIERLRIESGGTLFSKSPSDATPNFKFRSDDVNWHGYLNQTVHGATISTILSCGGTWTVDGTTYNATKDYNGSFGTAALIVHNQYNSTATGGELVFVTKANGSTNTDGAVSERFRIASNGHVGINYGVNPNRYLQVRTIDGAAHNGVFAGENINSSNAATMFFLSTYRDSSSTEKFMQFNRDQNNDSQGVAAVFDVLTNGNVRNSNNSYSSISDVKLKENIIDASSQWDDIKNVRVRKFNFKSTPSETLIGVVAQEIETVSPGLVDDIPDMDLTKEGDEGTTTKSVKYSILYMKAIKCLQEAQARIETLEAKVAALEGS